MDVLLFALAYSCPCEIKKKKQKIKRSKLIDGRSGSLLAVIG